MQKTNIHKYQPWRFYGRRSGHALSERKKALLNELLPSKLINLTDSNVFDPSQLFGSDMELWMEIGFGSGEHIAYQAEQYPEVGFIGCEPYINGVVSLLDYIEKKSLNNIRIYNNDARILIKQLLPDKLSRVFLLFSDPWPKKRHHFRRFVNSENLDALSRVMKDAAELKFSSDNSDFVRSSLYAFYRHKNFNWLFNECRDWYTSFDPSVVTRYERKAIMGGRKCVYLTFKRCGRV